MTNYTVSEYAKLRTQLDDCGECRTTQWSTPVVRQMTYSNRTKDSRPYPTDPLAALTEQDYAYKSTKSNYCISKSWPYSQYCNGKYTKCIRTQWSYGLLGAAEASCNIPVRWYQYGFWSDVQSNQVDLALSLANYDKVADIFIDFVYVVKDIDNCFRNGRCQRLYNRVKRLRDVVGTMFYVDYGIIPLVKVMHSALEEFTEANYNKLHRFSSFITDSAIKVSNGTTTTTSTENQYFKGYYILDPKPGAITVGDPSRWVWERLQFSFVIDWFIPIGQYLSVVGISSGVSRLNGVVSVKKVSHTRLTAPPAGWDAVVNPGTATLVSHRRYLALLDLDPSAFLYSGSLLSPGHRRVAHALGLLYQILARN